MAVVVIRGQTCKGGRGKTALAWGLKEVQNMKFEEYLDNWMAQAMKTPSVCKNCGSKLECVEISNLPDMLLSKWECTQCVSKYLRRADKKELYADFRKELMEATEKECEKQ